MIMVERNPLDVYNLRRLVKDPHAQLYAVEAYFVDKNIKMWAVAYYPRHGGKNVSLGYLPIPYTEDDIAQLRAKIMLVAG